MEVRFFNVVIRDAGQCQEIDSFPVEINASLLEKKVGLELDCVVCERVRELNPGLEAEYEEKDVQWLVFELSNFCA